MKMQIHPARVRTINDPHPIRPEAPRFDFFEAIGTFFLWAGMTIFAFVLVFNIARFIAGHHW